eukprot:TRINITY_DN10214_c0_g1_i2.p1 TRINITY_DN10214_c0_g1~~TRINITY_DN10214_c0_g1_i2.p1  ORF type:complete len:166 (-),score=68.91 TRINITY_DN10214_c0_g1_i2:20-517(-)
MLLPEDEDAPAAKVLTAEQTEQANELLDEAEAWLYDAEGLTVAMCTAKRAALGELINSIQHRISEYELRPAAVQLLRSGIATATSKANDWATSRAHIPASKLAQLQALATQAGAWLDEREAAQASSGLQGELAFSSEECAERLSAIKDLSATLLLIKPKSGRDDI